MMLQSALATGNQRRPTCGNDTGMTRIGTKKVDFLQWNSEDESERSQRGIAFRKKLKRQTKMASSRERIRRAEQMWIALIDPSNHGPLLDYFRAAEAFVCLVNFTALFDYFRSTVLGIGPKSYDDGKHSVGEMLSYLLVPFGELRPDNPNDDGKFSVGEMLSYLRSSMVSFEELRPNKVIISFLYAIGSFVSLAGIPGVSRSFSEDNKEGGLA
jgi:hypothetical protein